MYKLTLRIFGVIIALLCLFSALGYFFTPLWKVTGRFDFSEQISESLAGLIGNAAGEDQQELVAQAVKSLGEQGVTFRLSLRFYASDFIRAIFDRSGKPVEAMIEKNVDGIVNELIENLRLVVKTTAGEAVKTTVKTTVQQLAKNAAGGGNTAAAKAIEELMDDPAVSEAITDLSDSLADGTATVDGVTGKVLEVYETVLDRSQQSGNSLGLRPLNETEEKEIREMTEEVLKAFADSDGKIDLELFIEQAVSGLLGTAPASSAGANDSARAPKHLRLTILNDPVPAEPGEESQAKAALRQQIKAAILEKVDAKAIDVLSKIMMGTGIALLVSIAAFLYLLIKIIVKFPTRNPGVKLTVPLIFGWILFALLVILPSLLTLILPHLNLLSKIGIPLTDAIGTLLGGFTLRFGSSSAFAFVGTILLFLLSFYYGHVRKKQKLASLLPD